jgi:3-oxoacyl-ACP reductase-like protein
MNEKDVLGRFPTAFVHRVGVLKYEIRRPRTPSDPSALVQYVVLSGVFSTVEAAWKDAKTKLNFNPDKIFVSAKENGSGQ